MNKKYIIESFFCNPMQDGMFFTSKECAKEFLIKLYPLIKDENTSLNDFLHEWNIKEITNKELIKE
jgi:hypothetical protein